jgi:hypothetical protein
MTYDELVRRAEAVATQKIVVENYGLMNTPNDVEKRVKLDAAYMIARDKLAILEADYRSALRQSELDGTLNAPSSEGQGSMSDDNDGRHHETIWLQPWCDGCETHCRGGDEGRQWCQDDVWEKCDECGNKSVRYVIAQEDVTNDGAV